MNWLRNIRAAVGLGLLWAIVWAPVGVLIGTTIVDPDGSMDEPWLLVGAYPGFLCGAVFASLVRAAAKRRRLVELTLPQAASWGAASGLLVLLVFLLGMNAGLGTWSGGHTPWPLIAAVTGVIVLGSALSASASHSLARWRNNSANLGPDCPPPRP
jgi:hypothetical protein